MAERIKDSPHITQDTHGSVIKHIWETEQAGASGSEGIGHSSPHACEGAPVICHYLLKSGSNGRESPTLESDNIGVMGGWGCGPAVNQGPAHLNPLMFTKYFF